MAIGGHKLSFAQKIKLIRLGVDEIILAYDQDVGRNEDGTVDLDIYREECNDILEGIKISALIDKKNNILNEKESPCDNIKKFNFLYENKVTIRSDI